MQGEDIKRLCRSCGVKNVVSFIDLCSEFHEALKEANRKSNLTAITDEKDYWNKHVADSLLAAEFFPQLRETELKLADIGTGAGFPAAILAMAFPQLDVYAIDSAGKKISFIEDIVSRLGIGNLHPFKARAREINRKKEWQDRFDIITARAVSDATTLFRESKNMLKKNGGGMILYKTPDSCKTELEKANNICMKQGFEWKTSVQFRLPSGEKRQFMYGEYALTETAI